MRGLALLSRLGVVPTAVERAALGEAMVEADDLGGRSSGEEGVSLSEAFLGNVEGVEAGLLRRALGGTRPSIVLWDDAKTFQG